MSTNLQIVPFAHGDILTVCEGDNIRVVMPAVVKQIGLDWEPQRKRIERHPIMAEGTSIMEVPSAGGPQSMVVMTLEGFHTFLVTLHPDRITDPGVRERVLAYQRRAFRAVFEHFHGPLRIAKQRPLSVAEFMRVGTALKRETDPNLRAGLFERLDQITDSWGISRCGRDIGHAAPDVSGLLAQFWSAVTEVEEAGIKLNQSRRNHLIALNLPQVQKVFAEVGVPIEIDTPLMNALRLCQSPRFIRDKTVNCSDGKSRFCWTFSHAPLLELPEPEGLPA
ncbi:phage antirepressor N-terminal domain-containing protein [Novosphingobium sp.]|uniref:phage antirepressor N-terminal domain-containing protein n=1 Tax=Novosphingobium sp. TaxID=1874826 RepID=UPI001D5D6989|nr:phage antirepressor N-terminal domain-containing protein [Novosphingobium sp.]MBX9661891.1 phage antirepressor N-terminal domain-containing protein [Novosphingobium sp.]